MADSKSPIKKYDWIPAVGAIDAALRSAEFQQYRDSIGFGVKEKTLLWYQSVVTGVIIGYPLIQIIR